MYVALPLALIRVGQTYDLRAERSQPDGLIRPSQEEKNVRMLGGQKHVSNPFLWRVIVVKEMVAMWNPPLEEPKEMNTCHVWIRGGYVLCQPHSWYPAIKMIKCDTNHSFMDQFIADSFY